MMELWPRPKPGDRFVAEFTSTEGPFLRFLRRIGVVRAPLVTKVTYYEADASGNLQEIPKP
jgi:hypothetical protein